MRTVILGFCALLVSQCLGVDWTGKRVSIVGDSYSAYGNGTIHGSARSLNYPGATVKSEDQMWWAQVIREFGGVLETNRSQCGSLITLNWGLAQSFTWRAQNGQLGDPDIILVLGGLNDCWLGDVYNMTVARFKTGVNTFFDLLDKEYGRAEKYIVLCKIHEQIDYRWGLFPGYRNVLRDCARQRKYRVVDLDGYYGNAEGDFDTPESPHPTLQGMNKIAQRVISEIRNGPGGYRELYDGLKTDDRGYLVTDYVPNLERTKVTVRAKYSTDIRARDVLFYAGGCTAGVAATSVMSFAARYGGFTYVNSTDGGATSAGPAWGIVPPLDGNLATMSVCGNALTVDGSALLGQLTPTNVDANGHLVLFAERTEPLAAFSGMAPKTICQIRITEGDEVVRDFYPAISKEGVATLWDSVTDSCLPVSGGGAFMVSDQVDHYVNLTTGLYYGDLLEALAAAEDGETVRVKVRPTDSVAVAGRLGVSLDLNDNDNVTLVPSNGLYRIVQTGDIQTIVIDPDIMPIFDCEDVRDLFKPEGGMLKVRLSNVRKGLYYAIFTTTDIAGPWVQVGEYGLEKSDFEVPAPPQGTTSFFIRAVVRE